MLIVEARYYAAVADQLVEGAAGELERAGASHERLSVPGAFEIPAAIACAAAGRGDASYDGYIALGCVIRGETSHYDIVCTQSARKLQDLAGDHRLAIGYGILTCETGEQAMARARVDRKNKGGEAARACLAMIAVRRRFALDPA